MEDPGSSDKNSGVATIQLKENTPIYNYLHVTAETVKLPELDPFELQEKDRTETYPPLILDGASGVGKTQQAFALLKGGSKVVYLLPQKVTNNDQKIYQNMTKATESGQALDGIQAVVDLLLEETGYRGQDKLSRDAIGSLIAAAEAGSPKYQVVIDFIHFLWSRVIEYKEICSRHDLRMPNFNKTRVAYTQQLEALKGKVLFVDEALPSQFQNDSQDIESSKQRLKFLRNFGRAISMRVVLAGTAATAANMWTVSEGTALSRIETEDLILGEVEYLYRKIKPDEELQEIFKGESITVRPLVNTWHSGATNKIEFALRALAQKIRSDKPFSDESKFAWLSGAFLSSKEIVSSPFLLQPSTLVRDHFFEPALLTYEENNEEHIYEGIGYKDIKRTIGPHRLQIIKIHAGELNWILSRNPKGQKPLAISSKYAFIEYALSNCVQVCLATEAYFAVAISIANRFEGDDKRRLDPVKRFQGAFCKVLPETLLQRNVGRLDGELHEQIIFAALQLASNRDINEGTDVKTFVQSLDAFLRIKDQRSLDTTLKNIKDKQPDFFSNIYLPPERPQAKQTDFSSELYEQIKIPWLVPACDEEKLREQIKDHGKEFFGDLNIAALVPGTHNSRMDATAYYWNNGNADDDLQPAWSFEFKARSGGYSIEQAKDDLMKKTMKNCSTKKRKKNENKMVSAVKNITRCGKNEKHDACHAMLIGITNRPQSECYCETVIVGGEKYLRVVLLVGNRG